MEYQTVITDVRGAITSDINTVNKWQKAGNAVREFYGTEASLIEVKAQFFADAVIPALNKKHAEALAKTLPRKGTAEYKAMPANEWEAANQAKKDARAVAHTMFSRLVSYAWPKEKQAAEPRSIETRFAEEITALIKAAEKAESASFDIPKVIAALDAALKLVVAGK